MTAAELLRTLVLRLEEAGLAYAIAGSVASMVYGEPRATLDIDVVVRLDAADGERLLGLFPREKFCVDAGRVRTVIRKGLPDREAWLSPPEELILKKLQYFRCRVQRARPWA